MKKIPNMVILPSPGTQIIAADKESQRIIVAIGKRRIAFDFFTRITELSQGVGDRPAPVVQIKGSGKLRT
jgi:hypothetical protein